MEEEKWKPVEEHFGIRLKDIDQDSGLYRTMCRIEAEFENGNQDIEYYAALYGY